MSDPVEDDVAAVRARVDELSRRQQRVVAELAVAEDAEAEALRRLSSEFGVASEEEARVMLDKLDRDLRASLAEVRSALDTAEGGAA